MTSYEDFINLCLGDDIFRTLERIESKQPYYTNLNQPLPKFRKFLNGPIVMFLPRIECAEDRGRSLHYHTHYHTPSSTLDKDHTPYHNPGSISDKETRKFISNFNNKEALLKILEFINANIPK